MALSDQSESVPRLAPNEAACVEDAIRSELIALGVSAGLDVMARRIRRRLEADVIAPLQEALSDYGRHKADCARLGASDTRACDCGYADARRLRF